MRTKFASINLKKLGKMIGYTYISAKIQIISLILKLILFATVDYFHAIEVRNQQPILYEQNLKYYIPIVTLL